MRLDTTKDDLLFLGAHMALGICGARVCASTPRGLIVGNAVSGHSVWQCL